MNTDGLRCKSKGVNKGGPKGEKENTEGEYRDPRLTKKMHNNRDSKRSTRVMQTAANN